MQNGSIPRRLRFSFALVLVSLLSLVLAACNSATPTATPVESKLPAPANSDNLKNLTGGINSDGSSTVFPISREAAVQFNKYAPKVTIVPEFSGTSGGFRKFCNAEIDIAGASRPIKPVEVERCAANKVDFIELPVAYDGLAIVVNPKNTWVDNLSVPELKKMWEESTTKKITSWKQVRDSFPDKPITFLGAGADSGTYDYFLEAILGKGVAIRQDYSGSEDDDELVRGVAANEGAIGFFGYAYTVANPDKVKAIPIKATDTTPAVAPGFDTVKSGAYRPLSRPLFIYVRQAVAQREEVKAFVNFYLSPSFTPLIQTNKIGYIALDPPLYEAITKRFNSGTTGTLFPKGTEVGATLERYLK
jgi:phosphate transport system substrate-binding protein